MRAAVLDAQPESSWPPRTGRTPVVLPGGDAVSVVIFVAASLGAFWGHYAGHQFTAALVYVVGVTWVGSQSGLRGGLLAAVLASVIFNFFLSEPLYRFSMTSADEGVPLIAFALGAGISGTLAGRLNDRARAAEKARRQLELLLVASRSLQRPLQVSEIPLAIADFLAAPDHEVPELYVVRGGRLDPVEREQERELALQLFGEGGDRLSQGRKSALAIRNPTGLLAVMVCDDHLLARLGEDAETVAFLNVLSLATERCLLLERLADSEALERSEALKTALLSSVSHDLRTPLAAIAASATSLSSYGADLSEEVRGSLLHTIEEQCERLNRYTANILSLGRVQFGLGDTDLQEVEAVEVLSGAVARARSLSFRHTIVKQLPAGEAIVRADPIMLEQSFFNVIENAVRHTPGGRVSVAAEILSGTLRVSIVDEGAGIPVEELGRIFDRFYRGSTGGSREGSGLGLSIAKGFVEAFGGSICAISPNGARGGSCFQIELPLRYTGSVC